MKKENELINIEPLVESMQIIAQENIKTIEKIEKGEKVDLIEILILHHSTFAFTILKNFLKGDIK